MLKFKQVTAALLLLVMLVGMLPVQAFALESDTTEPTQVTEPTEITETTEVTEPSQATAPEFETLVLVNPVYADVISGSAPSAPADIPMLLEDDTYTSLTEAANALKEAMIARKAVVTINLESTETYDKVYQTILDMAVEHNGIAGQGDNLLYQYGTVNISYSKRTSGDTNCYYAQYTFDYMSSAAQDAAVAQAVTNLREDLMLDSLDTDVEKIVCVYTWMCDNITYDHAGLDDDSDRLEYTAYDAIINRSAVCQGYANLFYWIMLEEGIDCRIVSGTDDRDGAHAWNIVKVGSKYYNVDATWDAEWKGAYFLKGSANFNLDHFADSDYTAASFTSRYPIDTADYITALYSGSSGTGNTWSVDNGGNLTISGTGAMNDLPNYYEGGWYDYYMCIYNTVVVEDGITSIGDFAFGGYPFSQAKVGADVTRIGQYAFASDSVLTKIYLPASLTTVDFAAFYGSDKLETVVFCGTPEQWAAVFVDDGNESLTGANLQYHEFVNGVCAGCGNGNCGTNGHSWVAADCDTPKTCSVCGDTEGTALGHSWVAADCDTPKTCSVCGDTEGAALGHSWVAADCDTPKTCSVCSATEGAAAGHSWVAADCDTPKTCSVCGATEGAALGHSWVAADCDTPKTCSVCSATEGAALGHSWVAADCDTPKTCSVCSATEGAAAGHSWVDADCDTPKTCSVCSATEGDALGHSWVAADCDTPKTCPACGATEGDALGHSWVAADCDTPKTCTACGDTEGAALGHNYEDGVCTRCDIPFQTLTGKCGTNLTWTLDGTGTLSIEGTGAMTNYSLDNPAPWQNQEIKIRHIGVEAGVTSIGNYAFYGCGAEIILMADTVKTIGAYALAENNITELYVPQGVTSLGDHAVADCDKLAMVFLPDTLKTIGRYAFARTALTDVEIPDSVTTLEQGAFYSCPWLEVVYISAGLNTIGERAFQYCQNLFLVVMPGSVTRVEAYAFSDCASLSLVYYLGTEAEVTKLSFATGNEDLKAANWHAVTYVTKDPDDVITSAGTTATFSTGASRENVEYQWYYLAPGSEVWIPCEGSSAQKATYTVTVTEEMDGYLFWCIMTDEYGNEFACNYATLTVVPAPEIIVQPESITVKSGEIASVTVQATGTNLTYTWYYTSNAADTSFSKSSVTTATYSTTMDDTRDGRQVYCVITDQYGASVTTVKVTLTMEKTPLVITQQPANVQVASGAKAATTVKATGDGLTYTWYFAAKGSTKFSKSSTTTATYSTTMDASRDGRKVYCVITDKYGQTVTTETVTLTMEKTPLVITQQPTDATVVNGASAKTAVKATGDGLKYTWYFTSGGSSTKFSKSSITTATYSTTMNADRDGRKVYCVITDTYGQTVTTETVTLHMKDPAIVITTQPQSVEVTSGATAKVTVEADGEGLTYTWYYANKGKTSFTKSSYKTATYSTTMDLAKDGRRVYCKVTDKYGNTVKTATATLSMEKTPLVITQQPSDVTVGSGATAKTSVVAQGDGLTYTWYFTSGGASTKFSKSSITTAAYSTTMNADRSGRKIYCVVSDQYGNSVKTNTVTLSMVKTPLAITQQPANVQAADGAKAATAVKATGDGLTYTWYFTSGGSSTKFSKSSITSATYSTTMDSSRDGRRVYCVITDAYGESVTTDTVTLTMKSRTPLVITQQPVSVAVANGETASTTVAAEGDGLTYTWYFTSGGNSTKFSKSSITSATYSTTMDASRDGRQVYCVVTDTYGRSVATNTVTLSMTQSSVGTPLKIITQPVNVTVANGATAQTTVVAQGDGLTYEWYYTTGGTATKFYKSSTTTATYSTVMDATRDGRKVYCVITDAYGNTVTTNTVTLKLPALYLNQYGTKYHYDKDCAGTTAYASTLAKAQELGRTACTKCVG